jgi:hypothetical protein
MKLTRLFALFLCLCPIVLFAQSAEVGGAVQDPAGALIPKASVEFRNQATVIRLRAATNREGRYHITGIDPGKYDATVVTAGFKTLTRDNIQLEVGDKAQIDFQLQIGHVNVTVKVDGSGQVINTTDASVGTVIDREFVQNIPLNGRSLQSLILLSPGVATATPQGYNSSGDFSINGQRTSANSFSLDGASAMNTASGSYSTANSTGSASSMTALGMTQAIISVDALQEFRIATSTYSAEFGRQSGGQIGFTSRSGTNDYHGTAFEYLRNYALDANNWFNTYSIPALPIPTERQNDFGGVLGGPVSIPGLFSGKDRAFFFFSYEGLRLNTPTAATISYVPSNGTYNTATYSNPLYKNLRANAPDVLKPILNAFPVPNCSTAQNPSCVDYGDGLSPFITSMSTPSTINAISARVDFQPLPWLRMFARYNDTGSSCLSYLDGTGLLSTVNRIRTYLLGGDSVFHNSVANELRLQYSPSYSRSASTGQSVGGSVPLTGAQSPNLNTLSGLPPVGGQTSVWLENFGAEPASVLFDNSYGTRQFQPNAIDTISWTHLFKAGIDYRQTTAYLGDGYLSDSPNRSIHFRNCRADSNEYYLSRRG